MFLSKQLFSKTSTIRHAAAAAKAAESQSSASSTPIVTKLPNNLTVTSLENNSTVTRIAVAVKAGSRYEPAEIPGVSHVLRNSASLATKELSSFALNRSLEQLGCNLTVSSTRDHLYYVLEGKRDSIDDAIPFLSQIICEPSFKAWEVADSRPRMEAEIANAKAGPEYRLIENLHKTAYRGGLSNSLLAPKFAVNEINADMVRNFWKENFIGGRISIAGLGIDQDSLLEAVTANFQNIEAGKGTDQAARYGGGQLRKDTVNYLTYAAVTGETLGKQNVRDALSAQVLQAVLGPQVQWWANGEASSKLIAASHKATNKVVGVSALNIAHSDSGLFGFSVVAPSKEAGGVIKACVGEIKKLSSVGVSEAEIGTAKEIVKTNLLIAADQGSNLVMSLASQALRSENVLSPEEALNEVDNITAADVNKVLKNVSSSKLSYSAVGNLSQCPYLEDIQ